MPKTSPLDVITQQLDALTFAELLEVRARVDALIEGTSPFSRDQQPLSHIGHHVATSVLEADGSLEKVIEMVDEWMADESGYDQETNPQIEEGLKQNCLFLSNLNE